MTEDEKKLVYILAQKLTGAHPEGTYQHGIFLTNVETRMRETHTDTLEDYLKLTKSDPAEHARLISSLSIHTTSWFRENTHYVILQKILLDRLKMQSPYKVWSCACSTGEEVYSFALLFEEFRQFHLDFNYAIHATDIDPVSLERAKRAIYHKKDLRGPVSYYKKHVKIGSGPTEDYFTFSKQLRERCEFKPFDIRAIKDGNQDYDLIVCRNVLIYFAISEVESIVEKLLTHLRPGGHLILGHSEMIDHQKLNLQLRSHAVYEKPKDFQAHQRDQPVVHRKMPAGRHIDAILIGGSTGGPQALSEVLSNLTSDCPPVVVVQHIAQKFAQSFAERLGEISKLKTVPVDGNSRLQPGCIYVADSDHHIVIRRTPEGLFIRRDPAPAINGHRPSVDALFSSAAEASCHSIAILLSGMGKDGAIGIEKLHNVGAYTVAQSESDCVIFGMPKEAIARNAVDFIGSAKQIRTLLSSFLEIEKAV